LTTRNLQIFHSFLNVYSPLVGSFCATLSCRAPNHRDICCTKNQCHLRKRPPVSQRWCIQHNPSSQKTSERNNFIFRNWLSSHGEGFL